MTTLHPHSGQPILQAGAPLDEGNGVVVMIHGRNASAANILSLTGRLERPGVTYLAPEAAGNSWYPYTFLSEIQKNEPYLSSAITVLQELTDGLVERGIGRDRIIFLGFSQGACLSAEFVVRHPARWGGVIAFSGGLIGPPGTTWPASAVLGDTPVFLGCSDVDAHIPKARVDETAGVFTRAGAAVTLRFYPGMGHSINDDELTHARTIIDLVR